MCLSAVPLEVANCSVTACCQRVLTDRLEEGTQSIVLVAPMKDQVGAMKKHGMRFVDNFH